MLIQRNKFYPISNKSGVAELIWTVTQLFHAQVTYKHPLLVTIQ